CSERGQPRPRSWGAATVVSKPQSRLFLLYPASYSGASRSRTMPPALFTPGMEEAMERRYRVRLEELIADAEVPPGLLRGVLPRLEAFLQPFVGALGSAEQQTNARHYVQGLLADLPGKDVESIAYLHDRERQGLQ